MSNTKWRHGPWFLEGNWEKGNGRLGGWVSSRPPMPVFELKPLVGDHEEIIANANLIAAAPELYDALCDLHIQCLQHDIDADMQRALENAAAAMTKARGE